MQPQLKFSGEDNQTIKSGWLIALAVLLILYIAFRLWRLTAMCLWFDEIFSVHAARHGFTSIFSFVAQDLIHPPLFYLMLKFWMLIGGESLLWIRLFPVLFSCIAVIPFWLLCKELRLSIQTTALAFLFLAVNGSLIKYAQEVRMYSPLFCLSLFSLWLFVKFFNSLEHKTLIALSIINLLLVYTHYFGWLIVLTEIIFFALYGKNKRKEFFFSCVALALTFAPWAFVVIKASNANAGLQQNIGWATKPNLQSLYQLALVLVQPFYFQSSSNEAAYLIYITPPIALICFAAIVLFAMQFFKEQEKRLFAVLAFLFSFLPIIIVFIASNVAPYSFWGARHLIIVFAPFAILAAVAIQSLRVALLKDTAVYLLAGFILFALLGHTIRKVNQPIWCAWEPLAVQAKQTDEPATKIYATEELIAYHLWFALCENGKNNSQIIAIKNLPDVKEDAAYFLPRGFYDVKIQNADTINDEHFRLAFRNTEWNQEKQPLKFFVERGYKVGTPTEMNMRGVRAFIVELKK